MSSAGLMCTVMCHIICVACNKNRLCVQAKAQADPKTDSPELAQVNFGPKYEQHVAELQARINELTALCAPVLVCRTMAYRRETSCCACT